MRILPLSSLPVTVKSWSIVPSPTIWKQKNTGNIAAGPDMSMFDSSLAEEGVTGTGHVDSGCTIHLLRVFSLHEMLIGM
jgi:hypothetical protein